jgi:hypothetical protein
MRIAVIGWGSLIWDSADLAMEGRWHRDGPRIPIEFARRSRDGRLTLVTLSDAEPQQTYWVLSACETLETARESLRCREGTPNLAAIHWATRSSAHAHAGSDSVASLVTSWLATRAHLDAAIWTGLPATMSGDVVREAVAYLKGVNASTETYRRARQYVVRAPSQIQTAVRAAMRDHGWYDEDLPSDLFE